jgi:hypothetical protein
VVLEKAFYFPKNRRKEQNFVNYCFYITRVKFFVVVEKFQAGVRIDNVLFGNTRFKRLFLRQSLRDHQVLE